jgi:hypothetical protein
VLPVSTSRLARRAGWGLRSRTRGGKSEKFWKGVRYGTLPRLPSAPHSAPRSWERPLSSTAPAAPAGRVHSLKGVWHCGLIGAAAEMEVLRPGLYLTHIQGQPILQESDERIRCMFGEAGRPVRLTLAQHDPRVRAEPARSKPAPSKKCAAASAARSGEQAAESSAAKGEAAEGGGDIGNGFTYNWKIGLYHNPETGYFYDHQTSTCEDGRFVCASAVAQPCRS